MDQEGVRYIAVGRISAEHGRSGISILTVQIYGTVQERNVQESIRAGCIPTKTLRSCENKKHGGKMREKSLLRDRVAQIYNWIDEQVRENVTQDKQCQGCGKCCDFTNYGHRLYITTPEAIYFRIKMGNEGILPMNEGVCPYMVHGKCSFHEHRFSGCRIFFCKGDEAFQSELSETVIREFKDLCAEFNIPYQYKDLASTLNLLSVLKR